VDRLHTRHAARRDHPTNPPIDTLIAPGSVHRRALSNGMKVLVRRDSSAPVVAIVTYVSAGYFDETDDVVGIAHVLEHMYFKGTTQRGVGEIAKQTKAVGGYLNAATIYDHTSYYTVLPSSGFSQGLEIQADAYANSLIDADELRRELEVIIQEANRKADNPGAVATETLYELLHDTHRMRRWRIGREAELRGFTRESLVSFYRNFYHPGNTVLSIVGDVDPDAAFKEVEARYGQLPAGEPRRVPGPTESALDGFRYREMTGDIGQTQIAFGWRTPDAKHPDTPVLDVIATVLGSGRASRLYRAVRDRKLASSISAYNYTPTELGVFVIHAEAPPEKTVEAARASWDQLHRLRDGDTGAFEVERAKRIYESRWLRRLEDMEGQANYLAEWESLGDWQLGDAYLASVLSATPDDVTATANRWLGPDRAGALVYRPRSSEPVADSPRVLRERLDAERPLEIEPTGTYLASVPHPIDTRPASERHEAGVYLYRTGRGVPVLVRPKPGAPLVHLGVFTLGGASEEPSSLAGLTTLMVRTAVKGTTRRTGAQIAEEAEMLGGSVGYSAGADSFGWSISVPGARAVAAAELLADVAQHAIFAPESVEIERAVAMSDIVAVRDDMYRYPMRLALQQAFENHPYGTPVLGFEETLSRVTAEDLRRWHQSRACVGPAVVAMVGDGNPDDLAAIAIRAFDALESGPRLELAAAEWPATARTKVESRDRAQTALAMMFSGPTRSDNDRFAAAMIAGVASGLGGRFFEELRDRQSLSYTVHAHSAERRAAGSFLAYMAMSPEKEEAARAGLLREFARLRDEPVTADELARAQTFAIGVHQIQRQSGASVLSEVVDAWLFGDLTELITYESRIRSVTPADLQRVARKYFDPERRVEGIIRGKREEGGGKSTASSRSLP
jgi:zinc protease